MPENPYVAQVVFQGKTGLAKDRFVNTWHFLGDGLTSWDKEIVAIADRLVRFYDASNLAGFWSSLLEPTAHINIYRFNEPTPRVPYITTFTFGGVGTTKLPEEIALCLSFTSGRNVPRGRGRIYLGPFSTQVMSAGSEISSRPNAAFLNQLATELNLLIAADATPLVKHTSLQFVFATGLPGYEIPDPLIPPISLDLVTTAKGSVKWAQFSRVGLGTAPTKKNPGIPNAPIPVFRPVVNGWIDNEWDGQSRRRVDSSARVTFPF